MSEDVLYALCALAALFIPLGFAWFVVSRTTRQHPHTHTPPPDRITRRPKPPMR